MKKLFSKATKEATGDNQQSFMGKVYVINSVQYVVEEVIAEGGFAIVFLVKGVKSGKKFALKRLYVNNDHDLAVCKREIQIYSSLGNHKNIITYVDSCINRLPNNIREVLILMLYYKDSLITQLTDKVPMGGYSEEELLLAFCDLCEAVSRLHHCQTPIIHRDLKVENVLMGAEGAYLLCDFGSATSKCYEPLKCGVPLVEEDLAKYTTLSYRAPEMVDLYSGKAISTKADIWSLGCLFYRLSYLTPAFSDSSLAIQSGNYHQPSNHNFSPYLVNLIRYMLTVDPDLRPDIFQVSSLVFKMAGKPCPVANLHNTPEPNIKNLPVSEKGASKLEAEAIKSRGQAPQPKDSNTTSVIPRERPKASVVNNNLPISLIHPSTTPRRKKQVLTTLENQSNSSASNMAESQRQLPKPASRERLQQAPNDAPKEFPQPVWFQSPSLPFFKTPENTLQNTVTCTDNAFQPRRDSIQSSQHTKPPFDLQTDQIPFQNTSQQQQERLRGKNPFLCVSSEVLHPLTPVANIFADFNNDLVDSSMPSHQQFQNNNNQPSPQNVSPLQASFQQQTSHLAQPQQQSPLLQQPQQQSPLLQQSQQHSPQQHSPQQPQQNSPHQPQQNSPQQPQQHSLQLQAHHHKQHRRNVSDTSFSSHADQKRLSAFRAYKNRIGKIEGKSKMGENGEKEEGKENEGDTKEGEVTACIKETEEDNEEDDEDDNRSKRPLSADPTSSQDWNPFSDDSLFSMQNDKVNRGSESSILGVKSREDLVMSYADVQDAPSTDPFSAAPLGPLSRMKKMATKKSKTALEEDASTDATEGYSKLLSCQEDERPVNLPVDPSTFVMQSESKQLLVTTTSVVQTDSVTNTVSKAATMSHDLLAGTARLMKKAVGGASDMYKQFVESGTEDNMQDGIVGSVEEGDLEGGRKFQLLSEVRDMLRMGTTSLEGVPSKEPAATMVVDAVTTTPASSIQSHELQAIPAVAITVTSEAPKPTFIGSILNQITGNSSVNSTKASSSTFQKFKNSEASRSASLDCVDVTVSSKTLVEASIPTTITKKSTSKSLVTSIIKNPFSSTKSSSEKEDSSRHTPSIKNQVSENDKTSNNASLLPKNSSSSIPPSNTTSSFKNPLKAGFDVFNAAPFKRKKQQEAKKITPPSTDTPQIPLPTTDPFDNTSNPSPDQKLMQQSAIEQMHPQVKQEKKSSSPLIGYKFSMDSFKFKSSKTNFNSLKNQNSLDKVSASKVEYGETKTPLSIPTQKKFNYQHQEDFADFNSFNSHLNTQSRQEEIVPKQSQTNINLKSVQENSNFKSQQLLRQKVKEQTSQQMHEDRNNITKVDFEVSSTPRYKQASLTYKTDMAGFADDDVNMEEEEEEEGDDDAGILWNKKLKKQDMTPRSKSLFDQSQVIKLTHIEGKSKFASGLSSPEEDKHAPASIGRYHGKVLSKKSKGEYPSSEFANLGFTDDPDVVFLASSSINLNEGGNEGGKGGSTVAHHTLPRMGSKKKALSKAEDGGQKGLSESQGSINTRQAAGMSISQGNSSNKVTFV